MNIKSKVISFCIFCVSISSSVCFATSYDEYNEQYKRNIESLSKKYSFKNQYKPLFLEKKDYKYQLNNKKSEDYLKFLKKDSQNSGNTNLYNSPSFQSPQRNNNQNRSDGRHSDNSMIYMGI